MRYLYTLVGVILCVTFVSGDFENYGLMFDAGSSSTKLHIYQWNSDTIPDLFPSPVFRRLNESDYHLRHSPGISDFIHDIDGLDAYFEPLMNYIYEKVNVKYYEKTYIFLKATAGMRQLDKTTQKKILDKIRNIFSNTPFNFEDHYVSIISGKEEGAYSWIAVNYLSNTLKDGNHLKTYGALDLGGASAQITFAPKHAPVEHGFVITLANVTYNLYTYSFADYGNDRAFENAQGKLVDHYCSKYPNDTAIFHIPNYCLPLEHYKPITRNDTDYIFQGRSQLVGCLAHVNNVIEKKQCESCSIGNVWQPPLRGIFYAISGFTYPIDFLELDGSETSLFDLKHAASKFCGLSYSELEKQYENHPNWEYITKYCFMSSYVATLLEEGLQFSTCHKSAIIFKSKIRSFTVSWAFGAMFFEVDTIENGNFFTNKSQIYDIQYK